MISARRQCISTSSSGETKELNLTHGTSYGNFCSRPQVLKRLLHFSNLKASNAGACVSMSNSIDSETAAESRHKCPRQILGSREAVARSTVDAPRRTSLMLAKLDLYRDARSLRFGPPINLDLYIILPRQLSCVSSWVAVNVCLDMSRSLPGRTHLDPSEQQKTDRNACTLRGMPIRLHLNVGDVQLSCVLDQTQSKSVPRPLLLPLELATLALVRARVEPDLVHETRSGRIGALPRL